MTPRALVVLIAAGATAIVAIALLRLPLSGGSSELGAPVAAPADARTPDPTAQDAVTEARTPDLGPRTPKSPSPRFAEPDEIEAQLAQFIAEQPGLEIVSVSSIDCGTTSCEIALTGTEVNPRYVGAYSELQHKLLAGPWHDFHIRSGALGTREIAPGAREYVLTFDYRPYVDLSADPLIAARQYAACAAFWRQQTEFPAPDDVVRGYLDRAEHYVALAASVLTEEEAARIAADTRGAPVIRGCW